MADWSCQATLAILRRSDYEDDEDEHDDDHNDDDDAADDRMTTPQSILPFWVVQCMAPLQPTHDEAENPHRVLSL